MSSWVGPSVTDVTDVTDVGLDRHIHEPSLPQKQNDNYELANYRIS